MGAVKRQREWTEDRVIDLLRARYKGTAWAFLPKVRNGTGWRRSARTADAIAMSLWPSRGLHLYGFEVKVDRGDWLREVNDPEKAEDIFSFCDFWYVVAPAGIVHAGELPKTWGLIEIQGNALKEVVSAPALTPKPVDSLFLASLLRKVTENMASDSQLEDARIRGVKEGVELGREEEQLNIDEANEKRKKAEERVETFQRVTGLTFDQWRPTTEVAEAIRLVLCGEDKNIAYRMEGLRRQLMELVQKCDDVINRSKGKEVSSAVPFQDGA